MLSQGVLQEEITPHEGHPGLVLLAGSHRVSVIFQEHIRGADLHGEKTLKSIPHVHGHVGFLLKQIHDCIEKTANQNLKQLGLTLSQMRVLAYLHERKGKKTSQKDIEDHFEVSHPTVVGILKRLENKGFLTGEFDDDNRRMKNVYLAEQKSPFYHDIGEHRQEMERKLLQGLSEEQVEGLRHLLKTVLNNVR